MFHHPAGGDLRRAPLQVVGYIQQRLQDLVRHVIEEAVGKHPFLLGARAREHTLARLVFARQEATGERPPDHHAQPLVLAQREYLQFDISHDQAVLRLIADKARPVVRIADPERLHRAPCLVVADGDVAHFALPHQVFHRAQRLFQRGLDIDVVHVVDVDPVGPQPSQAVFGALQHGDARQPGIVGAGPGWVEAFGRDHRARGGGPAALFRA